MKYSALTLFFAALVVGGIYYFQNASELNDLDKSLISGLQISSKAKGFNTHIKIDSNGVPHVWGDTDKAAFFAQGYTHAYYRLWQMEARSRAVESTLAEILGNDFLPNDRIFYHFQLNEAARTAHKKMMADPLTRDAVLAYVEGVNARIDELNDKTVPYNYASLKKKPRKYTSEDVARSIYYSAWLLTNPLDEIRLSRTRSLLSSDVFKLLFPWPGSVPSPGLFQESNSHSKDVETPQVLNPDYTLIPVHLNPWLQSAPNSGSNAWVIPAHKTTIGMPMLGHDFHGYYQLPNVYMPMQVASKNFNAIGSSSPGMPGILTGTNSHVAWGYVSSLADTSDWYQLDLKNNDQYLFNNKTYKLTKESIKIISSSGQTETISRFSSLAGPLVPILVHNGKPVSLAYRWVGQDGPNFLFSIIKRMSSQSANECGKTRSLEDSAWYLLTCIDSQSHYGVWTTGLLPIRPDKRDPRVVQLAKGSTDLWQGYYNVEKNPALYPATALIPLANQQVYSKSNQPYVGWKFSPPDRFVRFNELFNQEKKFSTEEAKKIHSDIVSARTVAFKETLLSAAQEKEWSSEPESMQACRKNLILLTKSWDGSYTKDSHAAAAVHVWLSMSERYFWDNYLPLDESSSAPNPWRLVELIQNKSYGTNDGLMELQKNFKTAIQDSLHRLCAEIAVSANFSDVTWSRLNFAKFHLTSEIGREYLSPYIPDGSGTTIFSHSLDNGTVYRSFILLDKRPRFWTALAGGLSDDHTDSLSQQWLKSWAQRDLFELPYYSSQELEGLNE